MKIQALIAAGLLALASPTLAYESDDYGFPIEPQTRSSYRAPATTYRSTPTFFRSLRQTIPVFSANTPARPVAPVIVRSRIVTTPTIVRTSAPQPVVVSARPSTTLQR